MLQTELTYGVLEPGQLDSCFFDRCGRDRNVLQTKLAFRVFAEWKKIPKSIPQINPWCGVSMNCVFGGHGRDRNVLQTKLALKV